MLHATPNGMHFQNMTQVAMVVEQVLARQAGGAIPVALPTRADRARALYQARERRALAFGVTGDLFGEPAWDIMLDLYLARCEGSRVSVKRATLASHAPATTALRWLQNMQDRGLIERSEDPLDRRRTFPALSDAAITMMESYLDA